MPSDDEIFQQLTEGITIEVPDVPDYATLNDTELIVLFNEVKRELRHRREMIDPTTERGKDLGGMYHGLLMEARRRRLM